MGRGDKKSKKGKIRLGSYGNSRRRKKIKERIKRREMTTFTPRTEPVAREEKAKVRRTRKKKTEKE